FGWRAHPRRIVFSIIWAMPASCYAGSRSMRHGCDLGCPAAKENGICFTQRLLFSQVELSVSHLPREAISPAPEIANQTTIACVVDSFLVRAANYAARHHD